MKSYIYLFFASIVFLVSCSDNSPIDNSSLFHFDMVVDGETISVSSDEGSSSQSTLGSVGTKGRYTVRAVERFVDQMNLGIVLDLPVELNENKEFTEEVFNTLFNPGRTFDLGEQIINEASLYYLTLENDIIKTYGSVGRSFLPNTAKVISREYIGKHRESGSRMHKVIFEFSSYMENMDDSSDMILIENGVVEVMVSQFEN